MARNKRIYDPMAVYEYINTITDDHPEMLDIIEGSLIDTYILYHDGGVTEVWEETYFNEWSSAYVRHIYRAGLPARFTEALESQEREYEEV